MTYQHDLLCSGKGREQFIEQLINKMATPFLKLENRNHGFHWEDFFAYQVPIAIYDTINKEMSEILKSPSDVLPHNLDSIKLPSLNSLIHTYRDQFFATHGIQSLCVEDFADRIEAWHSLSEDGVSLPLYLGMTEGQYAYMIAFGRVFV